MVLKLRIRVERVDGGAQLEEVAVVNSGFGGVKPELLVSREVATRLRLRELVEPEVAYKVTGDGRRVALLRYPSSAKVSLIDESPPAVVVDVLVAEGARRLLMNDKLISALSVVVIDPSEGLWCFKHELGHRVRRGV